MIPWEALLVYSLILVWAALLGWLPFHLLERISLVGEIDAVDGGAYRNHGGSGVACPTCGRPNETDYAFCGACGGRLLADD
jgi:DNA-directed RNA polymerase subunit RPC12/RpoP